MAAVRPHQCRPSRSTPGPTRTGCNHSGCTVTGGLWLVAYGELWVDDDEAEVELARLIVDPGERGQGLGRRLVIALADLAQSRHPRVLLRVHPDNVAARRCYAAAGFEPVAPHQAALWNAPQPTDYVWLSLAP